MKLFFSASLIVAALAGQLALAQSGLEIRANAQINHMVRLGDISQIFPLWDKQNLVNFSVGVQTIGDLTLNNKILLVYAEPVLETCPGSTYTWKVVQNSGGTDDPAFAEISSVALGYFLSKEPWLRITGKRWVQLAAGQDLKLVDFEAQVQWEGLKITPVTNAIGCNVEFNGPLLLESN